MAREFFCAYHSFLKAMEPLNPAERGRLFTALLTFSMTGEAPELTGSERFVFPYLADQISRDARNYESKCEKNRENIGKRWDTNVYERIPNDTNVYERIRTDTNYTKTKTKTRTKTKTKTNSYSFVQNFEKFWNAYPRRQAKKDAEKAWMKLEPDEELTSRIISAVNSTKDSPEWKKEGGKFIPLPSTYLNGRRWEDEQVSVTAYDPWGNA